MGAGGGGEGAKNFQCMNFFLSHRWLQEIFSHVEGVLLDGVLLAIGELSPPPPPTPRDF